MEWARLLIHHIEFLGVVSTQAIALEEVQNPLSIQTKFEISGEWQCQVKYVYLDVHENCCNFEFEAGYLV